MRSYVLATEYVLSKVLATELCVIQGTGYRSVRSKVLATELCEIQGTSYGGGRPKVLDAEYVRSCMYWQ